MSESSQIPDLDDGIAIERTHDGRWAWVDEDYDGPGTKVVEWIELVDLEAALVDVNGVRHLQFSDGGVGEEGRRPLGARWLRSSHWVDVETMR